MLCPLRAYPEGFGLRLLELYEGRRELPSHLRHKAAVDLTCSDMELFDSMPLGDPWLDAELHHVFFYLYSSKHLVVPDSWMAVMSKFNDDLIKLAPYLYQAFIAGAHHIPFLPGASPGMR